MVEKTANEMLEECNEDEDAITMKEIKKIADTINKLTETEYDCPSRHPELGFKVPVLDLAEWVEDFKFPPKGWMIRSFTAGAATMRSACHLESLSSIDNFPQ